MSRARSKLRSAALPATALITVALVEATLVEGCDGSPAPDAGHDAAETDAALPPDAARPRDGGPDALEPDAFAYPDVGPDLGPLGCSMPGMATRVEMPVAGEVWTARLDPALRADFHVTSCAPRARTPDVVLEIMPGTSGRLVLETTDPDLDTILAVRTRCDDEASELACNDDSVRAGGPSRISLDVRAGVPLFVIVDARGTLAPIPVRATILPTRAAGELCDPTGALDACGAGTACAGEPARCRAPAEAGCPPDGAFVDLGAYLVDRRARYEGTLAGLPDRTAPIGCAGDGLVAGPEAVHRLTLPFRAKIDAIAYGLDANVLYVRRACTDPASEVTCEGWGGITAFRSPIFEAGEEVFFFVERRPGAAGDAYALVVDLDRIVPDGEPCETVGVGVDRCEESSICRDEGGASRLCRPVLCGDGFVERAEQCDRPPGVAGDGCDDACQRDDSCESPIDLGLFGELDGAARVFRGSTRGGLDRFTATAPCSMTRGGSPDVYFTYTAPAAGTLRVSTESPDTRFDTIVAILDGCPGTVLGCNDDVMSGVLASRAAATVTAGQRVRIVVDGYSATAVGDFVLRAEVTP